MNLKKSHRLWVFELFNFSSAGRRACLDRGVGYVNVSGHMQKDTMKDKMLSPAFFRDLALVFTELDDPMEHLIGRALEVLNKRAKGAKFTRTGLLLVTAANRCTTYCTLNECNRSQNKFVSRSSEAHVPLSGYEGWLANIDDATNRRMFPILALLPQPGTETCMEPPSKRRCP